MKLELQILTKLIDIGGAMKEEKKKVEEVRKSIIFSIKVDYLTLEGDTTYSYCMLYLPQG